MRGKGRRGGWKGRGGGKESKKTPRPSIPAYAPDYTERSSNDIFNQRSGPSVNDVMT